MDSPSDSPTRMNRIYGGMAASYIINVAALLALFFVRKSMPFDFTACIIAAAVAISLAGRFYPMGKILGKR